jgi:integrase
MHVWTIRVRLQIDHRLRDLTLFDIALDSKLTGCDVVALRLADIMAAGSLRQRATIIQQKTGRPVQFEITPQTRRSLTEWLKRRRGDLDGWLFPSRIHPAAHLSTRQYIRLVKQWVALIGLEPAATACGEQRFLRRREVAASRRSEFGTLRPGSSPSSTRCEPPYATRMLTINHS